MDLGLPVIIALNQVDRAEQAGIRINREVIADLFDVPVIASGGVGTLEHLVDGVLEGGVDAVLAASIFHFGTHTIAEAHEALARAGITVRDVPR